jgi:amidase
LRDIDDVLLRGSISEIGAAIRSRRVSVSELVDWYQKRIGTYDKGPNGLNAVRSLARGAREAARAADDEIAKGQDRGPLHGIPVLLKDNILTSDGLRASAGALALADFVPKREATIVRRLREHGAIVLGKTNMTEFADYVSDVMPSEFSAAGGVVRNPHGTQYGRGQGSSVGSCAAVAAGFVPFAIGTETQNSIQTTACHTSVVGAKPSVGLVSRAGIVPLVPSQDSPGPIARTAADAALVLHAIAGPDSRDTASFGLMPKPMTRSCGAKLEGVRIGVLRRGVADRPEFDSVRDAFADILQRLATAGATIVDPCDLPSAEQIVEVRSSVFRTEFKAALNDFLAEQGEPCGIENLAQLIAWNEANPAAIPYGQSLLLAANDADDIIDANYRADRARDLALCRAGGIDAAIEMGGVNVLITPMGAAAKCTGKAGYPVIALPAGRNAAGAPFGITLIGSLRHDADLLAIAAAADAVIGQRLVPRL